MKLPFVRQKKYQEVVAIAEKRLFELKHLATEKTNVENYMNNEIVYNHEALARILENSGKYTGKTKIVPFNSTVNNTEILRVKEIFNNWGSDKSSKHNYEIIYAEFKKTIKTSSRILEIGCGSNDPEIRHAMSPDYIPLSSLQALREIYQTENIEGADIDVKLEINNDFKVHYLDQFKRETLEEISKSFKLGFDLIIDDGVHDISANYLTLMYFYKILNPQGKYVIEDVPNSLIESWSFLLQEFDIMEMEVLSGGVGNENNSAQNLKSECAIVLTKEGK
ncbi:hypothetical protein LBMAG05_10820 [Actinomycetes bacterium]|nr:hypothetical protein LBMAG05_10820 [Actinomycetes bacterium]